jgi:hypothetical protein
MGMMLMNLRVPTGVISTFAALLLAFQPANAGNVIAFSDTYTDKLVNETGTGVVIERTGSASIEISVPLVDTNSSNFTGATTFTLSFGPVMAEHFTLGDDPSYRPGKMKATFHDTNAATGEPTDTFVIGWSSTNMTVTGTAHFDLFGAERRYGEPRAGTLETTRITDVYDMNVSLGAVTYDNPNVPVSGENTDTIGRLDGATNSLESGSIRGEADLTPPTINVIAPAQHGLTGPRSRTGIFEINVVAADNVALDSVWCVVNNDVTNAIELAGNFSEPTRRVHISTNIDFSRKPDFRPGWNYLQFYAVDTSSNSSNPSSNYFEVSPVFWVVPTNLTLQAVGSGTISGLVNHQVVNMGQTYPVTARPSRGWVFAQWFWTNSLYGESSSSGENPLNFEVSEGSNQTLTAYFVTNRFPACEGTYAGLFFNQTNGASPTNAGLIRLTVTGEGAYTGRLFLGVSNYSLSGQFHDYSSPGQSAQYAFNDQDPAMQIGSNLWLQVSLSLSLDTDSGDSGPGVITGSVALNNSPYTVMVMVATPIPSPTAGFPPAPAPPTNIPIAIGPTNPAPPILPIPIELLPPIPTITNIPISVVTNVPIATPLLAQRRFPSGVASRPVAAVPFLRPTNFWTVPLLAMRSRAVSTNETPGRYNVAIPPVGTNSSIAPGGCSYGTVILASNGTVALTLHLADGTSPAFSCASYLAEDGSFPFFAPLYGGEGVILGWLSFTNDATTPADLESTNLAWAKLPVADRFYTHGFSTWTNPFAGMAIGSRYVAPAAGTNILRTAVNNAGSADVPLFLTEGADGAVSVNASAAYDPQDNAFTVQTPNPDEVALTLTAANGLLDGSFVPAHDAKAIAYRGILLPGTGMGFGFFVGTNHDTGAFFFGTNSHPAIVHEAGPGD